MIIFKMIAVFCTVYALTLLILWAMSHTPPLEDVSIKPVKATEVKQDGLERLLDAIEWVESKGVTDAVGDDGRAVGSFQIWKIMVDDVNRILKRQVFHYDDRFDRYQSRLMCRVYLRHYCDGMTDEDKARCWNGGPRGHKKNSTVNYGKKVIKRMKGM